MTTCVDLIVAEKLSWESLARLENVRPKRAASLILPERRVKQTACGDSSV